MGNGWIARRQGITWTLTALTIVGAALVSLWIQGDREAIFPRLDTPHEAIATASPQVEKEDQREASPETLVAQGRVDEARELIYEHLVKNPQDPAALRSFARFVLRHGPSEAVAPALRAIEAPEDLPWSRRSLAVWLAETGDRLEARRLLDQLGDDAPDDLRAKGRVLAALGELRDRREAVNLLEQVRGDCDAEDLVLLAGLYESLDDWPRAKPLIEELADSIREGEAPAEPHLVREGEAPAEPHSVREGEAPAEPHLNRGSAGASPSRIGRLTLNREPLKSESLSKLVAMVLAHEPASVATSFVERLERREPRRFRAVEARARWLRASGKSPEATTLLIEHTIGHPKDIMAVAQLLESFGRIGPAESLLRTASAREEPRGASLTLARFLARHGRCGEAFRICERAWTTDSAEDVASTIVAVVEHAGALSSRVDSAASAIEKAVGNEPKSAVLRASLAALREFQGRYVAADRLNREALELDPCQITAMNNLAVLIALQGGNRAEALALIEFAVMFNGPRPELLDTRAVVRLAIGDIAAAREDSQEAAKGLQSTAAYFHLAQTYLKSSDQAAVSKAFKNVREIHPDDPTIHPLERAAFQKLVGSLRAN